MPKQYPVSVIELTQAEFDDLATLKPGQIYKVGNAFYIGDSSGGKSGVVSFDPSTNTITDPSAIAALRGVVGVAAPEAAQSAATANTALMQAALDAGRLRLIAPGTYWINNTLTYGSGCEISLAPGVEIKMVAGIRKPVMRSKAMNRMLSAPATVTLAWASGLAVTVTWASHPFTGSGSEAVWISAPSSQSMYNGVFEIRSVTDANTFVVHLRRVPTAAPTGTVNATSADVGVTFNCRGARLNYNYDGSFTSTKLDLFGLQLVGLLGVRGIVPIVNDAAKYSYYIAACSDLDMTGWTMESGNSDGVKIYGPAFDIHCRGVSVNSKDDGMSIQPNEPATYADYQPWKGDTLNCWGYNVVGRANVSRTSLVVLYPGDYGYMDNCGFDGVSGFGGSTAVARFVTALTGCLVGRVRFKGVSGKFSSAGGEPIFSMDAAGASGTMTVDQLDLIDMDTNLHGATGFAMNFVGTYTIKMLRVINPHSRENGRSGGAYHMAVNTAMTVKQIVIEAGVDTYTTGRMIRVDSANTEQVVLLGGEYNGDKAVELYDNCTNNPQIIISGVNSNGLAIVSARHACTVHLCAGSRITGATNGVLRIENNNSEAYTITSDGSTRRVSGSWVVNPGSGSPSVTFKGQDLDQDIGAAYVAKTSGSYCYNVGTGRGTIPQNRPVIADGTNWFNATNLSHTY